MSNDLKQYIHSLMTDKKRGIIAGAIKSVLFILSLVYGLAVRLMAFLYSARILKSYRPPCRVISVGNITLGGTGKTPLVLAIAEKLRDSGKNPVILSRGYKGEKNLNSSDEVELLRRRLPGVSVIVGKDRTKTARQAAELHKTDVILLDDGFQHWRLDRDIDIITVDVNNPFGNAMVIPRGILREPLSSLKRADMFVITKVGPEGDSIARAQSLRNRIRAINANAQVFISSYVPSRLINIKDPTLKLPLSYLAEKNIALVCGIAEPISFEETAKSLGAKVAVNFFFIDHHAYTEQDIKKILETCSNKAIGTVLTTEKDLPRLEGLIRSRTSALADSKVEFLVLRIDIKIDDEERFFDRLYSLLVNKG